MRQMVFASGAASTACPGQCSQQKVLGGSGKGWVRWEVLGPSLVAVRRAECRNQGPTLLCRWRRIRASREGWHMAGPTTASSPAVRLLGPAMQLVAVLRPHGPRGAGAPASLQHMGAPGGLRCQLSGGAGAARLGCRRADGWPLHRLAGGAAPSTWCWHAAPVPATSEAGVGIWGPMVRAGAVSIPHGPRAAGAEASLTCWRAAVGLFSWLAGSAGAGEVQAGAGGWKGKQKGQGHGLPGTEQERQEPCRQPSGSREALPSPPWARAARPCLAPGPSAGAVGALPLTGAQASTAVALPAVHATAQVGAPYVGALGSAGAAQEQLPGPGEANGCMAVRTT